MAAQAGPEREAESGYGLSRPVRSGNAFEETVELGVDLDRCDSADGIHHPSGQ